MGILGRGTRRGIVGSLGLAGAAVLTTGTLAAFAASGPASPSAAGSVHAAAVQEASAPAANAERGEKDDDWCEGNGGDNESRNRGNSRHCRDGGEGDRGSSGSPQRGSDEAPENWDVHYDECTSGACVELALGDLPTVEVPRARVEVSVNGIRQVVSDVVTVACRAAVVPTHRVDVQVRGQRVGPYDLPPNRVELTLLGNEIVAGYDRQVCANL